MMQKKNLFLNVKYALACGQCLGPRMLYLLHVAALELALTHLPELPPPLEILRPRRLRGSQKNTGTPSSLPKE